MKNFSHIISLAFLLLCASTVEAQLPLCLNPKVTTLPANGDYGGTGQFAVTRQSVNNPDTGAPAPVSIYLPSNATANNRVPVIFFAHGFGGTEYQYYDALLRQMASNGYAVVFVPYTANIFATHPARYAQMWAGFQVAVQQYGAILDTSKVGFAGHSYGAGAVPELTRRGVAAGWGANGLFLFIMAPWYQWGSNYEQIPAAAKMIVQVYYDDETNEHLIGQNDIWNRLPQITERKWQVLRASSLGCQLTVGHRVPVTGNTGADGEINALDAWGVWRKMHALADYTFTGHQAAKNVAFTETNMGRWRTAAALRFVTPLEQANAPVVNPNQSASFTWASKCSYALGSPCP